MNQVRTVEFLPEIFQTPTNKKFLSATLDQLVQEPKLKRIHGFVGRTQPAATGDYIVEDSIVRQQYQFEPTVVSLNSDGGITQAVTYPEILQALQNNGIDISRHDRLFNAEYYAWDPMVDFDKLINFSQYYWLPGGPDAVDVYASVIPIQRTFDLTAAETFTVTGLPGENPPIYVLRNGEYRFSVNQLGHPVYIQASPGVDGVFSYADNISSRDVLGVTNNGDDVGEIVFSVPSNTAQDVFYNMPELDPVDLVTDLRFDQINHKLVEDFLTDHNGIDGITSLDGLSLVFKPQTEGWVVSELFDVGFGEDFDAATPVPLSSRTKVWRISYVHTDLMDNESPQYIELQEENAIPVNNKFKILYGAEESNRNYYLSATNEITRMPLLTANLNTLYYQDATDPNRFGEIIIVDESGNQTINVEDDVLGQANYTSGNGVKFTNGLKVRFQGNATPTSYLTGNYYVEGVGTGIILVPEDELITPESYAIAGSDPWDFSPYDELPYDASLSRPSVPDYITINRASADRNAWSRSNRWVHVDVIEASAQYNSFVPVIDHTMRASRPIIEFAAGLQLFNHGQSWKGSIDLIDFSEDDALSDIAGLLVDDLPTVDGYQLQQGTRLVFAADADAQVRNKIFEIVLAPLNPDDLDELTATLVERASLVAGDTVVCANGSTNKGKTFLYNGEAWRSTQQKTKVNQPPLYDVVDTAGVSYGDTTAYLSSAFAGSKLFGYAVGSGTPDRVLGFPLKYQTLGNVGDIVFTPYFFVDTFPYVGATASVSQPISDGRVENFMTDELLNGWRTAATTDLVHQVFTILGGVSVYDLDVPVKQNDTTPSVKVFVNGAVVAQDSISWEVSGNTTAVSWSVETTDADIIEIKVLSPMASVNATYSVPLSLEKNAFNELPTTFTLGSLRTHYLSAVENLFAFSGQQAGKNNSRDLGNIVPFATSVIQHSAPAPLIAALLTKLPYNLSSAIDYVAKEYEKTKIQILDYVARNEYALEGAAEILDDAIEYLTSGKTDANPFYWSDMLPSQVPALESRYDITIASSPIFDTVGFYGGTTASHTGVLVYLNDTLLVRDYDYEVATDGPRITLSVPIEEGDVVVVREYDTTYGSCVPDTPTKLGLYPAFKPERYLDETYDEPVEVIKGHDGSITVAFGDIRDDVLMEFEKRIYNNLKIKNDVTLTLDDVASTAFRTADYTAAEIAKTVDIGFISWIAWQNIDYRVQDYDLTKEFSWNYSDSTSNIGGSLLSGFWREIYVQMFGTDTPHLTPWEMVGFSEKPLWWENEYGTVPYTNGNLVLWDDLAEGKIADPDNPRIDPRFARPNLQKVIPVDGEGNLLSPFDCVVADYDQTTFRKEWTVESGSPARSAWRKSSSWPFVVQKILFVTRPAQYLSLNADRDRYKFNDAVGQYVYDDVSRLRIPELIFTDGEAKHSYFNWVTDYARRVGADAAADLTAVMSSLDMRLTYRMGGFTDKRFLRALVEKTSPASTNASSLLPDESYNIVLHKSVPIRSASYSSVVVQKTEGGYRVYGVNDLQPYFSIFPPIVNSRYIEFTSGSVTVKVARDFGTEVKLVPYGYEYRTVDAVVNFLNGYSRYLISLGFQFNTIEGGTIIDWATVGREFVQWSRQNWPTNSLISLNPAADKIVFADESMVVDSLLNNRVDQLVLNQNKKQIKRSEMLVDRVGHEFSVEPIGNDVLGAATLNLVTFEHMIVFDNKSTFGDVLYEPASGLRQTRIRLSGFVTTDWTGRVDAPGFIINDNTVTDWQANRVYSKGQVTRFKGQYWAATQVVQPAEVFDFSKWMPSEYANSAKGLLANAATRAEQSRDFYNKRVANLEQDVDLMSLGVVGFRQRAYLQDLDLDDISQVGVYNEFIRTKGTLPTLELFNGTTFNGVTTGYEIYENWAIKNATYGANANRSYIEILLNEDNLQANPAMIEIIEPGQSTTSQQGVLVSSLYKKSGSVTSDVYPMTAAVDPAYSLPTAGFVDITDVDFTVFDLSDLAALSESVATLQDGSLVWVAKVNRHDWDVYRATVVDSAVIKVQDALNGYSVLTMDTATDLAKNAIIVIKSFDDRVDGAYRIAGIISSTQLVVELSLPDRVPELTGKGFVFEFESIIVDTASGIADLPNIETGAKIWVNDIGGGRWGLYERSSPYAATDELTQSFFANDLGSGTFGEAVTLTTTGSNIIVGDPAHLNTIGNLDSGALIFSRSATGYSEVEFLATQINGRIGAGQSVTTSTGEWLVLSAPESDGEKGYAILYSRPAGIVNYLPQHVLVGDPGARLSEAVAISADDQWLFVASPGVGKVDVYRQQTIPTYPLQAVTATAGQTVFSLTHSVTTSAQLIVTVDNVPLVEGTDFTASGSTMTLLTPATAGQDVRMLRRTQASYQIWPGSADLAELFADYANDYSITVTVGSKLMRNVADYTISGDVLTFAVPPTLPVSITVGSYYDFSSIITTGIPGFGSSLAASTNGDRVLIGSPDENTVYVYARNDTKEWGPGNSTIIATTGTVYSETQSLESNNPTANAEFGHAIAYCRTRCSAYVASPGANGGVGQVEWFLDQGRVFGVLTSTRTVTEIDGDSWTLGAELVVNGFAVPTALTVAELVDNINAVPVPNVKAEIVDNRFVLRVISQANAERSNMLSVFSTSNIVEKLGLNSLQHAQTITPPREDTGAAFGDAVLINATSSTLVITAPYGSAILPESIDGGDTTFDLDTMSWQSAIDNSGAVYMYDLLSDITTTSVGQFVLGQEIVDRRMEAGDRFGISAAIDDTNCLVIGSPDTVLYRRGGEYFTRSEAVIEILSRGLVDIPTFYAPEGELTEEPEDYGYVRTPSAGRVVIVTNTLGRSAWSVIEAQRPVVDVALINSVSLYNKNTMKVLVDVDFIDPIQGKILGAVKQNIDFISTIDPARYNLGTVNNLGRRWSKAEVGSIWWNTENTRFLDYYAVSIESAAHQWGKLFPGSTIDVYEWVESDVVPEEYVGTPFSTSSYTVETVMSQTGAFVDKYYFWARGTTTVNKAARKTMSAEVIARYIADPRSSGIPYIAILDSSTIALYNLTNEIVATDTVLHIEYDKMQTENNVHVEYELVQEGKPTSFVSARIYKKLIDSFCGLDSLGNAVPDRTLSPADLYGVETRPRQSMFKDRHTALKNYIQRVNSVLIKYPIVETRVFHILNSYEPIPTVGSGEWDKKIADLAELEFQSYQADIDARLPYTGKFRYLVESDSSNNGRWTVYEVTSANLTPRMVRVQNYDTREYWDYADWYEIGFRSTARPTIEVTYSPELEGIVAPDRTLARVKTNGIGRWELYERRNSLWVRVGLEKGTIQLSKALYDYSLGNYGFDSDVFDSNYYDQEPSVETRRIIEAINEELLIGDLLAERNSAMVLMFNYILSEQTAPEWLTKTSLIDVEHRVRELLQDKFYKKDNQDFVLDYITEVKPYHTKLREFSVVYSAFDEFTGSFTDFDVPAYFNTDQQKFISPVVTTNGGFNINEHALDDPIWDIAPWSDWFDNFSLSVTGAIIVNAGSGYTSRPTLTVIGAATVPAIIEARINSAGRIIGVVVLNPGSGYFSTPTIEVSGGNGTGGSLTALTTPSKVRSLKTAIKLDRVDYDTSIRSWDPSTAFSANDIVLKSGKFVKLYDDNEITVLGESKFNDINAVDAFNVGSYSGQAFAVGDLVLLDGKIQKSADDYDADDLQLIGNALYEKYTILLNGTSTVAWRPASFVQVWPAYIDLPDMTASDRTDRFYNGAISEPGHDIGQLVPGTRFQEVWVKGLNWSESQQDLDTVYQSSFTDPMDDNDETLVITDGDQFVSQHHAFSPEELMPGIAYDTMDLRVYQRPGADWLNQGISPRIVTISSTQPVISFAGAAALPAALRVVRAGLELTEGINFEINWVDQTVETIFPGDLIQIFVYDIGGGNQLYRTSFTATESAASMVLPVKQTDIAKMLVILNGEPTTNFTLTDVGQDSVELTVTDSVVDDKISLVALGDWPFYEAIPYSQHFTTTLSLSYALASAPAGSDAVNANITLDGRRLRPADQAEYYGAGTVFAFPPRSAEYQGLIAPGDVRVFKNDEELVALLDFTIDLLNSEVTLLQPAVSTDRVVVAITTKADYNIVGSTIAFSAAAGLSAGQIIHVMFWSETRELRQLTSVFEGPTITGAVNSEAFDMAGFDTEGFDLLEDYQVISNEFDTGRLLDAGRIWVTLNGFVLRPTIDFEVIGSIVKLTQVNAVNPTDVVVVTSLSNNIVSEALAYRIFKDMIGRTGIYRISDLNETILSEDITAAQTEILVEDVEKARNPALIFNKLGVVSINGERITFMERDYSDNALRQIRRGTAGTGAAAHLAGSKVIDISEYNKAPMDYSRSIYPIGFSGPMNAIDSDIVRFLRGL